MRHTCIRLLIAALMIVSITACGGGGGTDAGTQSNPPDEGSSNWDQLVWDRDNWE